MAKIFGRRVPVWVVILAAVLIPGSGHLLLGRSMRGLVFLFWIIIFGYLTYHLTTPDISFIGRLSGAFAVWTLSVLEVYKLAK